jgi:hypothetical protein
MATNSQSSHDHSIGSVTAVPITTSWSEYLPLLLVMMSDDSAAGRIQAEIELRRMATVADLCGTVLEGIETKAHEEPSTDTPEPAKLGKMAKELCGRELELQVCYSAAGFYLGTYSEDGPCTRESREYWRTRESATGALRSGAWSQRDEP